MWFKTFPKYYQQSTADFYESDNCWYERLLNLPYQSFDHPFPSENITKNVFTLRLKWISFVSWKGKPRRTYCCHWLGCLVDKSSRLTGWQTGVKSGQYVRNHWWMWKWRVHETIRSWTSGCVEYASLSLIGVCNTLAHEVLGCYLANCW